MPRKKNENKDLRIEIPQVVPFRSEILAKSNKFIGTKYKASVLENQITYLAMLKIQEKKYHEEDGDIVVLLKASEIKDAVGNTSGSFYEALKRVADDMTANNMGLIDDENERFAFISLVSMAVYDKGDFKIYFPKRLKSNLIDIRREFTYLPKNVVMKFKKPCSFPLYQLLKSICYYPSWFNGRRDNVFLYEIGLSELKLDMGVVNSNLPDVRRILNNGQGTEDDYDRAVAKSPDKMYNVWNKFNKQCLEPTIEEINEKSDIYVKYRAKTRGKGGKTYAVEFTVYLNGAEKNSEEVVPVALDNEGDIQPQITDENKFVIALSVGNLLSELNLNYADIKAICEAAKYDKADIEKAYEVFKKSKTPKDNIVGWFVSAIHNKYEIKPAEAPEQKKLSAAGKNRNSFMNFEQRNYDFDALEQILLNSSPN